MPVPWLRILDLVLGVTDLARGRTPRGEAVEPEQQLVAGSRALGHLEARLAGVVVAALKEAFERDTRRLELERQQMESERLRAERAMRLELIRQSGDREIGRLRLVAGIAIVSWIGTLFFSSRLIGAAIAARVMLGLGWALLLVAVAAAFAAQTTVARALARADGEQSPRDATDGGVGAVVAPWLVVAGLALVGAAVLVA